MFQRFISLVSFAGVIRLWFTILWFTVLCFPIPFAQASEIINKPGNVIDLPGVTPLPDGLTPDQQALRLEIKLSRRQVTLYRGDQVVKAYPIAVGRPGWETPTGTFKVMQMFQDPAWVSPLQKGITIPGGDPENPLGRFWIGFWTDGKNWIGFHGTPNPRSIGTAASHGCVRMYNQDIEELFQQVTLGTVVTVVR